MGNTLLRTTGITLAWGMLLSGTAFPSPTHERIIGSPSSGRMQNAAPLEPEGPGWIKLFQVRERIYGSSPLLDLIRTASEKMQQLFPGRERLQIGDLSARDGGAITRHHSHQNGLDADIAYLHRDEIEQDPQADGFEFDMLTPEGKVSPHFDPERNYRLLASLARDPRTQRIFIDRNLIHSLCRHAKRVTSPQDRDPVFAKLGHLTNHTDHFHLRVRCAPGQAQCINGQELRNPIGCR